MQNFTNVCGSLLLTAVLACPAMAADLVPWGEAGPWKILRDPNRGNGCLVETALSDGSYLRIGFDKKGEGKGYISSFNPAWSAIKEGTTYEVTVKFSDQSFVGEGKGGKLGDTPGIIVAANNLDLLVNLAKAESVNLSADGGEGLTVALKGSYDAIRQALVC
jgi:hypothetical protein